MGWNSVVIVRNDTLGLIEADKRWGAKVSYAIRSERCRKYLGDQVVNISARKNNAASYNSASVISQAHADATQLIVVGGNRGDRIGFLPRYPKDPKDMEEICKGFLESRGYDVSAPNI